MKLKIKPIINKEYILARVSPKRIIEDYLDDYISFDAAILSPLREEKNPSFTFKQSCKGNIIWRDWGTGKSGDCFDFVMEKEKCSFKEAIEIINNKYSLHKNLVNLDIERKVSPVQKGPLEKKRKELYIQSQIYTVTDMNYWNQFGVSLATLNEYNVRSCESVLMRSEESGDLIQVRKYSHSKPIYAYCFGNGIYKIYSPYGEKKQKFLYNGSTDIIEGFDQLPWLANLLVITKSMKDVLSLRELGYYAISLQGETNILRKDKLDLLDRRFNNIISLYDNDKVGKEGASKLEQMYGILPIFIPENEGTKDISEYIHKKGIIAAKKLLLKLIYGRTN